MFKNFNKRGPEALADGKIVLLNPGQEAPAAAQPAPEEDLELLRSLELKSRLHDALLDRLNLSVIDKVVPEELRREGEARTRRVVEDRTDGARAGFAGAIVHHDDAEPAPTRRAHPPRSLRRHRRRGRGRRRERRLGSGRDGRELASDLDLVPQPGLPEAGPLQLLDEAIRIARVTVRPTRGAVRRSYALARRQLMVRFPLGAVLGRVRAVMAELVDARDDRQVIEGGATRQPRQEVPVLVEIEALVDPAARFPCGLAQHQAHVGDVVLVGEALRVEVLAPHHASESDLLRVVRRDRVRHHLRVGVGAGEIRAAYEEWLPKFIEKKRLRLFAGCAGWLRPDGSWAIVEV